MLHGPWNIATALPAPAVRKLARRSVAGGEAAGSACRSRVLRRDAGTFAAGAPRDSSGYARRCGVCRCRPARRPLVRVRCLGCHTGVARRHGSRYHLGSKRQDTGHCCASQSGLRTCVGSRHGGSRHGTGSLRPDHGDRGTQGRGAAHGTAAAGRWSSARRSRGSGSHRSRPLGQSGSLGRIALAIRVRSSSSGGMAQPDSPARAC